jgi:CRP-like cAMP-binding protein
MAQPKGAPQVNRVLASLNRADIKRLQPGLRDVHLAQGAVLHEPGETVQRILFPHVGMVSLLAVMRDGKAIEVATVGREGVVGVMAGLGEHVAPERAMVQLPLVASAITAARFRKAAQASAALRGLIIASDQAVHTQVQATTACNALHTVEARLCRWILQTHDRNGDDAIPLTQEFLSAMLGVRRSSVGDVARKLQSAGLIRYSRGAIEILDRRALEAASCECYGMITKRIAKLLPAEARERRKVRRH